MAPLVFGCVFAGRVPTILLFCALAGLAFREFARATNLYRDHWITGAVYCGIASVGIASLMCPQHNDGGGSAWYEFFLLLPVYVVALVSLIPVMQNEVRGKLQHLAFATLGFIYIGWMFGHLTLFADATNAYGCLMFLLFATEMSDVAAFAVGKAMGKHPFRANVSPKKTWEGALAAFAVSMILPWVLRFSLPSFGTVQLILAGLIIGIGAPLGDLTISVIKRDLGIKDMGAGIPGHGGVLDRIDSLIYTAPLFFHVARYGISMRVR